LPPYDDDDDDDDDESDEEDANQANKENNWRPRQCWKPNPWYYGDHFVNTTNLNRDDGFVALLDDFGLLSDEEVFLANLRTEESHFENSQLRKMCVLKVFHFDEDGLLSLMHPLAFAAKANNDDLPNFYQAMNGPDAEGYYEAMIQEIEQLEMKDPWDIVPISEVPEGANILDSTWVF
jgi:hypothetical protein